MGGGGTKMFPECIIIRFVVSYAARQQNLWQKYRDCFMEATARLAIESTWHRRMLRLMQKKNWGTFWLPHMKASFSFLLSLSPVLVLIFHVNRSATRPGCLQPTLFSLCPRHKSPHHIQRIHHLKPPIHTIFAHEKNPLVPAKQIQTYTKVAKIMKLSGK